MSLLVRCPPPLPNLECNTLVQYAESYSQLLCIGGRTKAAYPSCDFTAHIPVGCRENETPPMLRVVEKPTEENQELRTALDELLHQALEAELEDSITRHRGARNERGRAQVVRNAKAPARQLVTGSGTLDVRAPRVNEDAA